MNQRTLSRPQRAMLANAIAGRALEHGLVFVVETGVGQVDANINELHGAISACGRKVYQSCGFIRKSKNYNKLSLSLNVASDIVVDRLDAAQLVLE